MDTVDNCTSDITDGDITVGTYYYTDDETATPRGKAGAVNDGTATPRGKAGAVAATDTPADGSNSVAINMDMEGCTPATTARLVD